jgi:hypothetical protein
MSATLAAPPLPARAPAEPTLADVMSEAWAAIGTGVAAACPVCAGSLLPRWSAGSGVVGGRCSDCGATLE